MPLVLNHAYGEDEDEKIDGIEAGEAGEPELALGEGSAAIGVVVGEDVAGDEEEDADEDVSVVDEGVEKDEMRRGEEKEDDEDGKESADSCEGRKLGLSRSCRFRNHWFGFVLRLCFKEA